VCVCVCLSVFIIIVVYVCVERDGALGLSLKASSTSDVHAIRTTSIQRWTLLFSLSPLIDMGTV